MTSRVQLTVAKDNISLDRMFFRRKGMRRSVSLELAGEFLGSEEEFTRYIGDVTWYKPLRDPFVLSARVRAGVIEGFGVTDKVPILERFFAGGPDSVRGYEYRTVGPKDEDGEPIGGKYLLAGGLECTYPLSDNVRVAVFGDTGQVWAEDSDISLSDLRSGVGLGIRVKIPRSPISFQIDYGWALDQEPGDRGGELAFGMKSF